MGDGNDSTHDDRDEKSPPAWLGSRRFWLYAGLVAVLTIGFLLRRRQEAARPDALVPVVSLTGSSRAVAGERSRYAVLVRDRFGAAIPNAVVRLGFWKTSLLELGRGTTGEGGEATIEVRYPDDFAEERTLVAVTDVGVAEASANIEVSPKTPGKGSIFVSSDKPMYQPGQTMHLRALAMAGTTPAADRSAILEIRTEDGIKVFREEKRTSAFGVVATDFVLADQVKLGSYAITVTIKGGGDQAMSGTRAVDVRRYSLPKMKVTFEDVTALTAEGVSGKARAMWIFGEPVVKSAVTVELQGWSGGNRTFSGVTDRNGVFPFQLRGYDGLKPAARQRGAFSLKAKVVAEGGMTGEATTRVATEGGGDLTLEAFPEGGVLVEGLTQNVDVVVTGGEQKEGITVQTKGGRLVKTSARGIARVSVHTDVPLAGAASSPVTLLAHGDRGSEGHLELTTVTDMLVVRPERDLFSAGESMRVTVIGAQSGDHVALRMTKGSEPAALGSCVVKELEAGCDVTLAVPKDVSGLVWLHAMSLPGGKREVRAGKRLVLVGGGTRDLDLKVTPDRAFYAPRDNGSVDVAVTGLGGAPVQAQLGVAVADEAVFALAEVRPDLERIFFTVDRDLDQTRWSYSSHGWHAGSTSYARVGERPMPAGFEASAAYDPATDSDVRSTILAVLTTMPDVGAADATSSSAVFQRAAMTVDDQRWRLLAWTTVLVTVYALLAFLGFAIYGGWRFRSPVPAPMGVEETAAFRRETRAFYTDWLIAALGPPVLTLFTAGVTDWLGSSMRDEAVLGSWLVLLFFCTALLVRAVLRLRRAAVAAEAQPLRRFVVFLPVAAFLAHLCVVLVAVQKRHAFGGLFATSSDSFFLPLAVLAAAQLTCGALSVVRQTLLREVTRKGRIWLFLSRATMFGLPVTLLLTGLLVNEHLKQRLRGWADYGMEQREAEQYSASSDNKEGGTGTRAKGEEGSMGNPSMAAMMNTPAGGGASGTRFAVRGPGGAPEPARTRDYFPETLLWAPEVITDESGHAKVSVPFADSITTWRFGLRAVSKAGQLGSAAIPLVVKQDFFVDASLPPLLTQGDEIALPVTVYSYLPEDQEVVLEVDGEGIGTASASRTVLHLAPREARGFRFVVRADKAGDRVVHIKATGKTRADALERKVKVVPNGLAVVRTTNGRFLGSGRSTLELPSRAIEGGNDLFVKVYGGPLSQVSEGLDGVFMMPHGCFEQTSSTTYPSVLALQFLERSKAASPELEKKARQYIGEGYQRLISFEVGGGGFSLFGKSPASTTLSAYGLLEFSDMAHVAPVDDQLLQRTRSWLYGQRSPSGGWPKPRGYYEHGKPPPQPDDVLVTAYVAWALAAAELPGAKDERLPGVLDAVVRAGGPDADDAYGLALRANALLAGGRTAEARPLLDRLVLAMVRDDEGVHWTSKATGVMYSYGASLDVEVTGLASHALARAELQPEIRAGAASWLAARRGAYGTWSTTQATIAAMRALLDEAKPAPREPQDITVLVDGEPAQTFRLELAGRDVHRLIGLRRWATTGRHEVELRATGGADVAYQLVSQHYVPWQKQAPGHPSPLLLDVTYGPVSVLAGAMTSCHVHLSWRGKEAARMPLVEVGIPPAFEVDTTDLDKLVASAESRVQRYTVERSKVTLYLVDLPEDRPLSIDLPLRALRPARVVVPASTAYLYYEPEVRSETVPVVVRSL